MLILLQLLPLLIIVGLLVTIIMVFAKNKRRSIGVTLFSVWLIIQGISTLKFVPSIGIFAYALLGFFIYMSIGLIRLKNWARIAILATYAVISCWGAVSILLTSGQQDIMIKNLGMFIASLILLAILFFFFTRPKVKEQFRQNEMSIKQEIK